eukprot:8747684-Pyramimonas_sp.AAC.1
MLRNRSSISGSCRNEQALHKSQSAGAVRVNLDDGIGPYGAQGQPLIDPDQSPSDSQELAEGTGFKSRKGFPRNR